MLKRDRYIVEHCNGSLERLSLPRWVIDPFTLADSRPHSLFFYLIPRGAVAWDAGTGELIRGPAAMLVHKHGLYHVGPDGPRSEGEAFQMWRRANVGGRLQESAPATC